MIDSEFVSVIQNNKASIIDDYDVEYHKVWTPIDQEEDLYHAEVYFGDYVKILFLIDKPNKRAYTVMVELRNLTDGQRAVQIQTGYEFLSYMREVGMTSEQIEVMRHVPNL